MTCTCLSAFDLTSIASIGLLGQFSIKLKMAKFPLESTKYLKSSILVEFLCPCLVHGFVYEYSKIHFCNIQLDHDLSLSPFIANKDHQSTLLSYIRTHHGNTPVTERAMKISITRWRSESHFETAFNLTLWFLYTFRTNGSFRC